MPIKRQLSAPGEVGGNYAKCKMKGVEVEGLDGHWDLGTTPDGGELATLLYTNPVK